MTISQRIFYILAQKHKKQKDLARYTGISETAISDWKKKGTNPSADKLAVISEFLEVSVEYLLTGSENTRNPELSENEIELLTLYKKLSARDQIKFIGRIEEIIDRSVQNDLQSTQHHSKQTIPYVLQDASETITERSATNLNHVITAPDSTDKY